MSTWIVTGQYSWSGEFKGRDAINNGLMGHLRSLLAAGRPRTLAFNFIAEGDYVVVEARGDNVTKSGERYDNQYCMVWRIEDGKIKQIKEYCDSALVERVLGPFPAERKVRLLSGLQRAAAHTSSPRSVGEVMAVHALRSALEPHPIEKAGHGARERRRSLDPSVRAALRPPSPTYA